MIFIIVALLIAIVSVIIGYNMMAPNDNGLGTAPTSTNSPASATNMPTDTANNVSSTSSPSNSASKNGYSKMTISGVTCVYPSTFNSNPTTGNQKLNLTDALGGAAMTVSQEERAVLRLTLCVTMHVKRAAKFHILVPVTIGMQSL